MGLKLIVIGFFLLVISVMLIFWINTIPTTPQKNNFSKNPKPIVTPADTPEPESGVRGVNINPSEAPVQSSASAKNACVDKCGDNLCQLIVCQGSNCPCAENPASCPQDCQ